MKIQDIKDVCIKNNVKVEGDYITFDKNTKDFQLTKNFRLQEFLTKNKKDTTTLLNLKIIAELQVTRDAYGSPIGINSSYRSPEYNSRIGGAKNSQHVKGNALDIYPVNKDVKALLATVIKFKTTGGIGQYNTFVHIDCRVNKAFGRVNKMEAIKELITNFLTSSLLSKLLIFLSAFFAPVWELYLLLMFLVAIDYLIDLFVWFFKERKYIKAWEVTKPFVVKVIMYSILVMTVNAVQMHLIKEAFEFFKLVMAIPIIAELLQIVGTVEAYTGIAIVEKVKSMLGNWLNSKTPKNDE